MIYVLLLIGVLVAGLLRCDAEAKLTRDGREFRHQLYRDHPKVATALTGSMIVKLGVESPITWGRFSRNMAHHPEFRRLIRLIEAGDQAAAFKELDGRPWGVS